MNSKQKGDVTQLVIMTKLYQRGNAVLVPFGDNQRYDLVVDIDGTLQKIQCKTARKANKSSIVFSVASTYAHRGGIRKSYNGQVDFFGVYCPEIDKAYLIPLSEVANLKSQCYLRLDESSGQIANARMAKEFEL